MILETLSKARKQSTGGSVVVEASDQAVLLHFQGVLLCRRGEYAAALSPLRRAMETALSYRARTEGQARSVETQMIETQIQMVEALERLGRRKEAERIEDGLGDEAFRRPVFLAREALKWANTMGGKAKALEMLRDYADSYAQGGYEWKTRGRGNQGDEFKPLELLRDMLPERSRERAEVVALMERTKSEDEALRQQALEELQAEMRGGRRAGEASSRRRKDQQLLLAIEAAKGPSKASKKKKKKRDRKKMQQQEQEAEGAAAKGEAEGQLAADVAAVNLKEEDEDDGEEEEMDEEQLLQQAIRQAAEAAAAVGVQDKEKVQQDEECPMCLRCFGDEDEDEEEEGWSGEPEVLGCGHRFHDVCMDRWLCKCGEKGLLPTWPTCRRDVVRGAAGAASTSRRGGTAKRR